MEPNGEEAITFEEYEAAYRRFVACLDESGVKIKQYGLDEYTRLFDYATEADDEHESATGRIPSDECYQREFQAADRRWQLQQKAPFHQEKFDRAVAFFTSSGLTDFPEDAASESLGALIMHARAQLGEGAVAEYNWAEEQLDRKRRQEFFVQRAEQYK